MDSPALSLVICTRNRASQLGECLEYVARLQPTCSWELVVVNNGSSDGTREVLEQFAAKVVFPMTIVFEDKPGQGLARNTGWKAARGDLIAYTDDDCYLPPDYIDRMREMFENERVGFVGGRVELFDPSDHPISIKTDTQPGSREPYGYIPPGWLLGASLTFRREVLDEIGGFDPDLGPGTPFCCDDADAQQRASFAGWRGLYTPNAVIAHHHRRKAKDANALMRVYLRGGGAYMMKFLLLSETRSTFLRVGLREW